MRLLSLLILTLAALLGIGFSVLNATPVLVRYYVGTAELPLSALLLGVLAVGLFLGWLASLPSFFKLKLEVRRLRRGQS